jgi:hypothetical protein
MLSHFFLMTQPPLLAVMRGGEFASLNIYPIHSHLLTPVAGIVMPLRGGFLEDFRSGQFAVPVAPWTSRSLANSFPYFSGLPIIQPTLMLGFHEQIHKGRKD